MAERSLADCPVGFVNVAKLRLDKNETLPQVHAALLAFHDRHKDAVLRWAGDDTVPWHQKLHVAVHMGKEVWTKRCPRLRSTEVVESDPEQAAAVAEAERRGRVEVREGDKDFDLMNLLLRSLVTHDTSGRRSTRRT